MTKAKLHADNPELLQFIDGKLHITILGGIKFTGLVGSLCLDVSLCSRRTVREDLKC